MLDSYRQAFSQPATYIPLALALFAGACFLAGTGSVADIWGALDLKSFRVISVVLLAMVLAGVHQATKRLSTDGFFPLLARMAALGVLVSALTVYLFRFQGTMIMAEGEAYEPIAAAFSDIKKGPLARVPTPAFVLSSIAPAGQPEGFAIIPGAGGRTLTAKENVLATGGVELRLLKRGVMPLVELTAAHGGTIAREYVRLDLDSPLRQDSFMFVNNPYEFTIRRIKDSADPGGVQFQVAVRRGKLKVGEGKVDTHTPLQLEAFSLTVPEVKRSAMFQMRCQTGYGLFMTTCALFAAVHVWGASCALRRRQMKTREN